MSKVNKRHIFKQILNQIEILKNRYLPKKLLFKSQELKLKLPQQIIKSHKCKT